MKKKMKKFMVFLIAVLLIWFASHFFSSPLAEKGEISLENFVFCKIQTTEVIDQTGYVYGADIREIEPVEKLAEDIEGLKIRKILPWEKIHEEWEYPYQIWMQFDSEEVGRCEIIDFWKNGEIVFRGESYMITEGSKTQMTDQLEQLIENYETEE